MAIVPAAGKGERFGPAPKLAAPIGGITLLDRTIRSLVDGGIDDVVVVFAPGTTYGSVAALGLSQVRAVTNPDPSRGMFSSIQAGLAYAGSAGPFLILPGDMPFVRPDTVAAVLRECRTRNQVVSPIYAGKRGHPIAIHGVLRDVILAAEPTATLARVLDATGVDRFELPVDDAGILHDVDVPRDLRPEP